MVAAAAERLDVLVDDVGARRGQRHREVGPAADQHVAGERRRGRAPPLQAGGVHVHLVGQAGVEVADLRPADHQRLAGPRLLGRHHQHVAGQARVGAGGGAARPGERGRLEAARVEDHVAHAALGRERVGEGAADRDRVLGVVVLAQVVEDREALAEAELRLEPAEELRGARLVAAALADELALERVDGVDVGARPALDLAAVRVVVGVDAADEGVDVVQYGAALAAPGPQHARLLGDLALGLGAGVEGLQRRDQPERVEAGCVDGGDPRVVAGLLEQQAAVLGEQPAGGPDARVARLGGDVRDVVAVADDTHPGVGDLLTHGGAVGADRVPCLGLEVLGEVAARHVVEQRREAVVELGLGVGVGRRRDGTELARRDDVEGGGGVFAGGGRCRQSEDGRRNDGERAAHVGLLRVVVRTAARSPGRAARRPYSTVLET